MVSRRRWTIGKHHFDPVWCEVDRQLQHEIPCELRRWLLDTGSLTERLKNAAQGQFQVRVTYLCRERPMWSERQVLHMQDQQWALVRHVLLLGRGQPWVFARTVIPMTSLDGALRRLTHLGDKPLGAVLFSDQSLSRSEIEVAACDSQSHYFNEIKACSQSFSEFETIWGRRSVFKLKGQPLLVSEFFLPDILTNAISCENYQ